MTTYSQIISSESYPYARKHGCKQCGVIEDHMLMKVVETSSFKGEDRVDFLCRKHSKQKVWAHWDNENNKRAKKRKEDYEALQESAKRLLNKHGCYSIGEDDEGCTIIILN